MIELEFKVTRRPAVLGETSVGLFRFVAQIVDSRSPQDRIAQTGPIDVRHQSCIPSCLGEQDPVVEQSRVLSDPSGVLAYQQEFNI